MGKLKFVYIVYGVFIFPFEPHSLQREYSDNYRPLFLRKLNIQSTREKFDDKKKKKKKRKKEKKVQSTKYNRADRIKIVRPDKFPIIPICQLNSIIIRVFLLFLSNN